MQTKLFILTVAMIGIPTGSLSLMTGHEAMVKAYKDMINGGYSIRMEHWRPANCRDEKIIERRMSSDDADRDCSVCICEGPLSVFAENCNYEPCFKDIAFTTIDKAITDSWNDSSTLSPWESVQKATPFQVYKVSDGICYLTGFLTSDNNGRRMKCFTNRFYKPN